MRVTDDIGMLVLELTEFNAEQYSRNQDRREHIKGYFHRLENLAKEDDADQNTFQYRVDDYLFSLEETATAYTTHLKRSSDLSFASTIGLLAMTFAMHCTAVYHDDRSALPWIGVSLGLFGGWYALFKLIDSTRANRRFVDRETRAVDAPVIHWKLAMKQYREEIQAKIQGFHAHYGERNL